jgi:hypothetical protein
MQMTKSHWQEFEVSPDLTHHIIDKKPAYASRFLSVLKFHAPGLAPVRDHSGAFHIHTGGESAYPHRYIKTFGFYEGLAAVETALGWHHIDFSGQARYLERYAWCGNFQQGYCPVKDFNSSFFHINQQGLKAYPQAFRYVGDFREGFAVVQNQDGLHTHIDVKGHSQHGKWFLDLDVYHKGFAKAKDENGWFHIDFRGSPIYRERYKNIEPFYNGIARVETHHDALLLITEKGETVQTLRKPLQDEFHEVSRDLVSYWRFFTLQAANNFGLFDHLPESISTLAQKMDLGEESTCKLLRALEEMGYVENRQSGEWVCTDKGAFLQSKNPYSLKNACHLWGEEHFISWQNMTLTLKTSKPTFQQLYGKSWFDWLKDQPEKSKVYHRALATYAKRDYQNFCSIINFKNHKSLMDVGGSTGTLLIDILEHNSHLKGILLDLPEVVEEIEVPSHLTARLDLIPANFFAAWPLIQVESVVMSRVLHDWSDSESIDILTKVHHAISEASTNRLYLIEKIQDCSNPGGAMLDLHMQIITGGVERTLNQFAHLLQKAGFILEKTIALNEVSSVLIAKKRIF